MNIYNTFVISDLHFGHENMRRLREEAGVGGFSCRSASEMDEMLIDNWNSVVGPDDFVIVCGDFAWREKDFERLIKTLHGKKLLAVGNHDTRKAKKSPLWEKAEDILHLRLGEEENSPKKERLDIFCCHYPLRSWNTSFHGSFMIYGHTHADDMRDRREFNAGVDMSIDPYRPRRLDKVLAAMVPRWFAKRGGNPLLDNDPAIMASFRENYGKSFSVKEIIEETQNMENSMLEHKLNEPR